MSVTRLARIEAKVDALLVVLERLEDVQPDDHVLVRHAVKLRREVGVRADAGELEGLVSVGVSADDPGPAVGLDSLDQLHQVGVADLEMDLVKTESGVGQGAHETSSLPVDEAPAADTAGSRRVASDADSAAASSCCGAAALEAHLRRIELRLGGQEIVKTIVRYEQAAR